MRSLLLHLRACARLLAVNLAVHLFEHTYLALYTHEVGRFVVQHLIEGMGEVDKKGGGGGLAPRFLSFPDDRDFFYVVRRPGSL